MSAENTSDAAVELYWLPLGAGPGRQLVRLSGRLYERLAARRAGRPRQALYHSALRVRLGEETFVIEMAPVWSSRATERGTVSEGPVGLPWLGRSRLFRYEVRRWRDGIIDDRAYAVQSPVRLTTDHKLAARLLELVPAFPTATWGLDELDTGEMWNSNSLISWLLATSGHAVENLDPPEGGRAPGWHAGVARAALPSSPRGAQRSCSHQRSTRRERRVAQRLGPGPSRGNQALPG
jgi:hypothetical protein